MHNPQYAHEQKGGTMDFWDNLDAGRKRICKDVVDAVLKAYKEDGRAPSLQDSEV